jgi:acyl-CoA dehydrogenase
VLRRFEAEGRKAEDLPFMQWSVEHAFARMHVAFQGLYANLNVPVLGVLYRGPIALWGRLNSLGTPPSDRLGARIAQALQQPGPHRDRLTDGIFVPAPNQAGEHLATLERALLLHHQADGVVRKIKDAVRAKTLPKERPESLVPMAVEKQVITSEEAELLATAEAARHDAITVDSFTLDDYLRSAVRSENDIAAHSV